MSLRTLSAFALAALASLAAGCAAGTDDDGSSPVGESEDEATAAATSTYYRVVGQDFRKCAFPMCGGVYVARVNFPQTKCQDGTWQDRCYVATLDLAGLGLGAAQAEYVSNEGRGGRVLFRGKLAKQKMGGTTGIAFVASEAWAVQGKGEPSGTFYKVTDSGIQCITFPCPTINEAKLNSTISKNVTGLGLGSAGLSDAQQSAVWDALSSTAVMAAGTNVVTPKEGPAGDGTNLVATAVYTRVTAGDGFCQADADCAMSVYVHDVASKADCYCRTCPDAIDATEAKHNESAWASTCSKVKMTCPAVKCMARVARCVANQCTAVAP